jgi:hypothetical protein
MVLGLISAALGASGIPRLISRPLYDALADPWRARDGEPVRAAGPPAARSALLRR